MTPEERAKQVCKSHTPTYTRWGDLPQLVAAAIRAAVAEEREACTKAVCAYCEKGEPISDADECVAMGHFLRGAACHPFSRDENGEVNGHIACAAAGIRAR